MKREIKLRPLLNNNRNCDGDIEKAVPLFGPVVEKDSDYIHFITSNILKIDDPIHGA